MACAQQTRSRRQKLVMGNQKKYNIVHRREANKQINLTCPQETKRPVCYKYIHICILITGFVKVK